LWDVLEVEKNKTESRVPSEILYQAAEQKKEHQAAINANQKMRQAAIKRSKDFQNRLQQVEITAGAVPVGIGGRLPEPLLSAAFGSEAAGCATHSTNLSMEGPPENVFVTTKHLSAEETDSNKVIYLVGDGKENSDKPAASPRDTTLFNNAASNLKALQKGLDSVGPGVEALIASMAQDNKKDAGLCSSINELAHTIAQQQIALAQHLSCEKKKQHLQAAQLFASLHMDAEAKEELKKYQEEESTD
jgi:hypothetical protein